MNIYIIGTLTLLLRATGPNQNARSNPTQLTSTAIMTGISRFNFLFDHLFFIFDHDLIYTSLLVRWIDLLAQELDEA
jgi:hypothetical protein